MNVTDVAERVRSRIPQSGGSSVVAFDPMTIIVIISILKELVVLWKACKQPTVTGNDWHDKITNARLISANPGFLQRWKLWYLVKRKVNDNGVGLIAGTGSIDTEAQKAMTQQIYDALLEEGKSVSRDDIHFVMQTNFPHTHNNIQIV